MSQDLPTKTPPGWGADSLSAFLDDVRHNQLATFHNKKPACELLQRIDACYVKVGTNMLNPKDFVTPFFFYRAHSSFRAACACALAGQSVETYNLARSSLEYAAYGLAISQSKGLNKIWLKRNDDSASKKRAKEAFQIAKLRPLMANCDTRLAEIFSHLYELCIEQGAHPNPLGVLGSVKQTTGNDELQYLQIYLHGDGVVLDAGLKSLVEVGICTLFLAQHNPTFKARFELLGVKEELKKLQKDVGRLVRKPPKV